MRAAIASARLTVGAPRLSGIGLRHCPQRSAAMRAADRGESGDASSHAAVRLDGTSGEGGGQILRSALALSMALQRPFVMENIRARRAQPGLRPQHHACVLAAQEVSGEANHKPSPPTSCADRSAGRRPLCTGVLVCNAAVKGAEIGSQRLTFEPGMVGGRAYTFRVGTSGSAVLVLQTLIPALMCAPEPSEVVIHGGTYNPLSPPFDFLQMTYLTTLRKHLGVDIQAYLQRPGFYPRGGGRLLATVKPVSREELRLVRLVQRGSALGAEVRSTCANFPRAMALQQGRELHDEMQWTPNDARHSVQEWQSDSPGLATSVLLQYEHVTECFTSTLSPKQKVPRAQVDDLARQLHRYMASSAPVGEYLADQLVVPMAVGRGGEFLCTELSSHARTQLELVQKFLPVETIAEPSPSAAGWRVFIAPNAS